jgi:excisionase family DNA binding protein
MGGGGLVSELLTVKDVANRLNTSTWTVYEWTRRGDLPAFRLGSELRYDRRELEAWVEAQRVQKHELGGVE